MLADRPKAYCFHSCTSSYLHAILCDARKEVPLTLPTAPITAVLCAFVNIHCQRLYCTQYRSGGTNARKKKNYTMSFSS